VQAAEVATAGCVGPAVIVWSAPSGRESSCLNFSISLRGACGVSVDQFCLAVVGRIETSRV
jgi:hypothetical protein